MNENALDLHGADWKKWIKDNLQRGCDPKRLIQDMTASVWEFSDAVDAIQLASTESNSIASTFTKSLPTIPARNTIALGKRKVTVLSRISRPNGALIAGLLSSQECQNLIAMSREKGLFDLARRSKVVDIDTGESSNHTARTSTSIHFTKSESPLLHSIEERLSLLTGWPIENGEGLQVLRYLPGQQYKPHFDWFDDSKAGGRLHLKRGGQRVATSVVYLRCAAEGGETTFPKAFMSVNPASGGAVFFRNVDPFGQVDPLSMHAGAPVISGEKIVLTYWQREGPFR